MVGFNRRFSPFTEALTDTFSPVTGPKQVIVRVNAGFIPGDNWQHDSSIGGGRLLGVALPCPGSLLPGRRICQVRLRRGAKQGQMQAERQV